MPVERQYDHSATFDDEDEAIKNIQDVAKISQHGEAVIYAQTKVLTESGERWKTFRIGVQTAGGALEWDDTIR